MDNIHEINNDNAVEEKTEETKPNTIDFIAFGVAVCAETVISTALKTYVPIPQGFLKGIAFRIGILGISAAVSDFVMENCKKNLICTKKTLDTIKIKIQTVSEPEVVVEG